ncbi:MAG: nitrilase-related carbon-nitrogen hydrolase, partial [Anaerolineales bacterium]
MIRLRLASVQMESAPSDRAANLQKIRSLAARAAGRGAKVAVFPELCTTGYWHLLSLAEKDLKRLAEPVPAGPSSQEFLRLAREHDMTVGAGILEVDGDGALYNT